MEKKIHRLGKCFFLSGAVLASAMLAGCSSEAGSVLRGFNGSGSDVQVSVSFADADKASSRAADGLDTSAGGFGNESAGVCIKADNQTAGNLSSYKAFSYTVASGGKSITAPNEGPKFPSGVNSVNVYGWYPYNNGSTSFTVQTNQQSSDNYCLSDLMLANRAACTRNASTGVVEQAASLTFRHVLSKVKVNLSLGADVTVSGVALKGILPTVAINESDPASLSVGSASGDATDITLLSNGSLTSSSPAADLTLCGVFPGQDKSGALLTVTASYNGGSAQTITYSLGSAKTFAGGKEYVMNISLDGTDITTGTVSIGDWNSTDGTVNIGHGALALSTYTLDDLEAGGIAGEVTVTETGITNNTITVASADPGVATASVTETTVTITPVAAGSTQVIVSAEKNGTKLFGVVAVSVAEGTSPTLSAVTNNWNDDYLGRYVDADGNVTEEKQANSIGRIAAHKGTDDLESGHSEAQIMVLALDDVSDNTQLKTSNTLDDDAYSDTDSSNGLAYCVAYNNSSTHPAVYAAYNWNKSRPSGSSPWFIPSHRQWIFMVSVIETMIQDGEYTDAFKWTATQITTTTTVLGKPTTYIAQRAACIYNESSLGFGNKDKNAINVKTRACFIYPFNE